MNNHTPTVTCRSSSSPILLPSIVAGLCLASATRLPAQTKWRLERKWKTDHELMNDIKLWDSDTVLTAGADDRVCLWNFRTGRKIKELPAQRSPLSRLGVTGRSRFLVTSTYRSEMIVFSSKTHKPVYRRKFKSVSRIAASRYSDLIAVSTIWDFKIHIFDCTKKKILGTVKGQRPIAMDFSPDDTMLASGGWGNSVMVWDLQKFRLKMRLWHVRKPMFLVKVTAVRFVEKPNLGGPVIVSGDAGGRIFVWTARNGEKLGSIDLRRHKYNAITRLLYNKKRDLLVTTDDAGNVAIFPFSSPDKVAYLPKHEYGVFGAAMTEDGDVLLTAPQDGRIHVWRLADSSGKRPAGPSSGNGRRGDQQKRK